MKFGRNYELAIQTINGGLLTVTLPFTMRMDITRKTLASANVCQVILYNLSEFNRNEIHFNSFNQSLYRSITVRAGYGTSLTEVFTGNISQAWSVREGVDFITQIECFDAGFAYVNGDVNLSFVAGTPERVVIAALMKALPNVTIGAIGSFDRPLPRGNTYSGNPAQLLAEITGGAFFIDNGKAYALKSDEYVAQVTTQSQPVTIINDASGLLGTPVQEQTIVRFDMLFEPSLNIGRLVSIASITNPDVNGLYRLTSVKHRGIISSSVGGELITSAEFVKNKENIPVVGL